MSSRKSELKAAVCLMRSINCVKIELNDGIFFFSLASQIQYWKVMIEKKTVIENRSGVYPRNQRDFRSCGARAGISGKHLSMKVVCQFFVVSQVWNK
jgi:hypothetical protein